MAKKRRSSQFKDSSQVIDIEDARRKRQEKRRRHRTVEANAAAAAKKKAPQGTKQSRRRRKIIYTAIVAVIIAVVGLSVMNIISLKQEQNGARKQQEELKEIKAEKEKKLKHLNDADYIEEQARAQLRLVMPGEKIYVFPSLEDKKNSTKAEKETTNEN